jgi:hypothetical protein
MSEPAVRGPDRPGRGRPGKLRAAEVSASSQPILAEQASTGPPTAALHDQHGAGRAGAKRLLPMASVKDILTIPGELFAKFQTGFYADPADAVFKALGAQ